MKKLIITILFFFISGNVFGDNTITIPYKEFKQLYKESIKKQVMSEIDDAPFIYSINTALYKMRIKPGGASCMVTFSGTYISGKPAPFKLFSNKIIIENINEVTGGSLLCNQNNNKGIEFFPFKGDNFLIKVALFIPAGEDNRSRIISMKIPGAIKNSLSAVTPKNIALIEMPGVKSQTGIYNFSPRSSIKIRYSNQPAGTKIIKDNVKALSTRFKTVDSPPIILDSITCFTSFEEGGNILSILVMSVPPETGDHFKIKSMPETSIWGLKVNGKKMKVFTSGAKEDYWIIPLIKGKASKIELAMLRKGEKLGLRGRLETILPKMELPSRKASIVIGLPPRVQLMSFEGDVVPDEQLQTNQPADFIGKPYYFSKSFYKGDRISIAVSYKEPVKQ